MEKASPNVMVIPINPEGALEMGLSPCRYCNYRTMEIFSKCSLYSDILDYYKRYDNCDYYKRHINSTYKIKEEK